MSGAEPTPAVSLAADPMPYEGWSDEALIERCLLLERERDRAREECGHHKAMRDAQREELNRWVQAATAAKLALVKTGYWADEKQISAWDIAPRIVELWAAFGSEREGDAHG